MRKTLKTILLVLVCAAANASLFAGSGVCFHCQEIRENNRLHPHNFEYYEDYLKELNKSGDVKDTAEAEKPQVSKDS